MYQEGLVILTILNTCAWLFRNKSSQNTYPNSYQGPQLTLKTTNNHARIYKRFIIAYVPVVAAEWLQGPFFWAVYRDYHGLAETTIGKLSATGFAAGALATIFTGAITDNVLAKDVHLLYAGRALGGLSATLLYSAFEPWLLGEIKRSRTDSQEHAEEVNELLSNIHMLNGMVAIPVGVIAEILVRYTASAASPFLASIVLLSLAALMILSNWSENYGQQEEVFGQKDSKMPLRDSQTQRLGLISFSFEATVFLVVYFWPAAIRSTRSENELIIPIPFGLIFANFMSAMMLGSTVFNLVCSNFRSGITPPYLCRCTLLLAALSLICTMASRKEALRFIALCTYEACIGVYNPMIASLKGHLIPDKHRSQIYGLFRLPTNIFVVVALSSIKDGNMYRNASFLTGSILLILGSSAASFTLANDNIKVEGLV